MIPKLTRTKEERIDNCGSVKVAPDWNALRADSHYILQKIRNEKDLKSQLREPDFEDEDAYYDQSTKGN